MTQNESTLQELAARLAREEEVNADLREKLANAQTGFVGQQILAPESLSRNQATETATDTPPPQVPGPPLRSAHRLFSTRRQVSLMVLLVVLIIGTIFGYQALRARSSSTPPAGKITEFALPTPGGSASEITAGPDGNLWFTETLANKIGRITPSGAVTEFAIPTPYSDPEGITAGPDGDLWFTETLANKIGRITPSGTITEFAVHTPYNEPGGITAGPDGNLWFTELGDDQIGVDQIVRMTPSGIITGFPVPTPESGLYEIVAGPDGNLWFTESSANKIGRITPSGDITEFSTPTSLSSPVGITAGPDGDLWFTQIGNQIGRITPSGTITEFSTPTSPSSPVGITAGPDGDLWFTESETGMDGSSYGAGQIGRITPSGTITEYRIPTSNSNPGEITAGPDGDLWFTVINSKIGRITSGK